MELESTDLRSDRSDPSELSVPPETFGGQIHKFVSFFLGDIHYAIPAKDVAEVTGALTPTPLPNCPAELSGIAPHRGDIIAVLCLDRTNSVSTKRGKKKAVVLRPTTSVELPVAFNVDRLGELLQVSTSDIYSTTVQDPHAEFATMVDSRQVFILEPARLLSSLIRT